MKVRISGSGIRFRLEAGEVRTLSEDGSVAQGVHVGPDRIDFVLGTIVDEAPRCDLDSGRLAIHLPAVWLVNWPENDVSGFDFDVAGGDLRIVVEKDFPCLHGEEGSSKWPAPRRMSGES